MTVKEFMLKSGCDVTSRCYEYLPTALEIAIENPDMKIGIIITNTANKKGKTYNAVSKGLERLIEDSYPNMDAAIKKTVFNNCESVTVGRYVIGISNAIRNGII